MASRFEHIVNGLATGEQHPFIDVWEEVFFETDPSEGEGSITERAITEYLRRVKIGCDG